MAGGGGGAAPAAPRPHAPVDYSAWERWAAAEAGGAGGEGDAPRPGGLGEFIRAAGGAAARGGSLGGGCPPEAAAALAAAAKRLEVGGGGGGGGGAGRGRSWGCRTASSKRSCSAVRPLKRRPASQRRWGRGSRGRPRGRGGGGAWALLEPRRPARPPWSAGASGWPSPISRQWKDMGGRLDLLEAAPPLEARVHQWWWRCALGCGACRRPRRRSRAASAARVRDENLSIKRAARCATILFLVFFFQFEN